MDAELAAWAAARRPRADGPGARTPGALALALGLAGHLAFFTWLHQARPSLPPTQSKPEVALEVQWIPAAASRSALPMPHKPQRSRRAAVPAPRPARAADDPEPTATAATARPRLLDQIIGIGPASGPAQRFAAPDPLRPITPRLPGSEVRIVGDFKLRREFAPKDIVAVVGGLFGAYDTCRDVPGLVQDATLLNPQRYDDAERRALFDRERRCGRR
jgi:hypothetical protein